MAVDEPLRRPKQGSQRAWPQGRATTGSRVSRQTGQLALAKTLLPQAFSWVLRQLGQVIMLFFACHVGVLPSSSETLMGSQLLCCESVPLSVRVADAETKCGGLTGSLAGRM